MNWDRWREFTRLFYGLDVTGLLRAHTPLDRWYLIDRLIWIIAVIESVREIETRETLWFPIGDDDDGI
jgi:hypothetical protein